jgi:hypothetical protein
MKRVASVLAAATVVTALLMTAVSGPATAAPAPADPVHYLDQTQWLEGPGVYQFRVGLAPASANDRVQVLVYRQVLYRSTFEQDAQGKVQGYSFYSQAVPVTRLPADPKGGYDLQLPVNQAPPAGGPFGTVPIQETGVFPVQIELLDPSGQVVGNPVTSFIVYVLQAASAGKLTPLAAGVIVPVSTSPAVTPTGTLSPPNPSESARLASLAGALNANSSVPASILASPLTLDQLAAGRTAAARTAVGDLNASTAGGGPYSILPSTYSPISLGELQGSLPREVDQQLQAGTEGLRTQFNVAPDTKTWAVDGRLDPATLQVMVDHKATQLIVPDSDLTTYPSQTTFAGSTYLQSGGSKVQVIAADSGLTADFTRNQPVVLAANILLADLAMIYTEAPNASRAVAVMPPADWSVSPTFVATLFSGLKGNPLVKAETAAGLFGSVDVTQTTRSLVAGPGAGPDPVAPFADQIGGVRRGINNLEAVFGPSQLVDQLRQQLLLAESDPISDAARWRVFDAITKSTNQIDRLVSLPPATSITLTSTQGVVPITILTRGTVHPRVILKLTSPRLIFLRFVPRNGTCQVQSQTTEICDLTLVSHNTTLKVPVETRSSGVFPLLVAVDGGNQTLKSVKYTVRSTAVSGVAVVLIIVALLALVLWWGRDLRRGRRPKDMVPAPVAEPALNGSLGDPDVDSFFDRPPPDFGAMSPSGGPAGPTGATETYGLSGRETGE